jgi:hypothetical protein
LIAFWEFMFEDIEPIWLNKMEKVIRNSLKIRMENQKKKSLAWTQSHWWGRQKSEVIPISEKQQKNNKKTTEQTTKKQEDKDKDKEYNILLSKDNKEDKSSYGDVEINECLDLIKSYNNWIINGSTKKWRQYANHLITNLKKIDNVKNWKIKRQDVLKMILEVWKANDYYSTKTTSPELIYYNLSTLMEVCRKEFKKQQWQKTFTAL